MIIPFLHVNSRWSTRISAYLIGSLNGTNLPLSKCQQIYYTANFLDSDSNFSDAGNSKVNDVLQSATAGEEVLLVSDGKATVLPRWARAYLSIGETIAQWDDHNTRMVVGIALPTRAYAALMISAGIVLEREKTEIIDATANFHRIMELPLGTALLYKVKGKSIRAVFDGTQTVHGDLRLRVRVQKKSAGGGTYLLDAPQALALEVLPGIAGERGLSDRVHRARKSEELFLKNFLSHTLRDEFLLYPRLDCLVIGTTAMLREETQLGLVSTGRYGTHPGTLQDILKVRKFIRQGQTYRSEVMALGIEALPDTVVPYLTIFDGALSFLKWRDSWRQTHWIAVLDRTETHFPEAVNVLNQQYVTDRMNAEIPVLPTLPAGMEILLFKERP